jgi:aspartate 4-decarboxylase
VRDEPKVGLAGMPAAPGIGKRLQVFLSEHRDEPGAALLKGTFEYGVDELGFHPDAFAHELADASSGQLPRARPDARAHRAVVHEFLMKEMCGGHAPKGKFDIFAVEGGTAAMCYIFHALKANGILNKGTRSPWACPSSRPTSSSPHRGVQLQRCEHRGGLGRTSGAPHLAVHGGPIRKLEDPKVKAFFVVNPSNPPSLAVSQRAIDQIVKIVKTKRPDLLVLTDDVYGTFVPGFRSLATDLPYNTILVYSYSKHFGAPAGGWASSPSTRRTSTTTSSPSTRRGRTRLNKRYSSLTTEPEKMRFIDRMVAESRCICLNHTAGLSLPQQMQMLLFSSFALLDKKDAYAERCRDICRKRLSDLYKGPGDRAGRRPPVRGLLPRAGPGSLGREDGRQDFVEHVKATKGPLDLFFRLANDYHTVLLNGSGFAGPPWSVRVSLANLDDEDYVQIGRTCRTSATRRLSSGRESNAERSAGASDLWKNDHDTVPVSWANDRASGRRMARSDGKRCGVVGAAGAAAAG